MQSIIRVLILILPVLLLSNDFTMSMASNFGNGAGLHQLYVIGTVDSKTYFGDPNNTVTWIEANKLCSTSGMHLATITSLAQMTLLKEKSRTMPFQKCAWIGGRDALTVSQFAWEFNKESLNTSIVSLFEHQAGVRTCLCFNPYNNLTIAVDCVTNRNVMCELIYGK